MLIMMQVTIGRSERACVAAFDPDQSPGRRPSQAVCQPRSKAGDQEQRSRTPRTNEKFSELRHAEILRTGAFGAPRQQKLRMLSAAMTFNAMAVQFRDYYETLGVSKTANEDEIRTLFENSRANTIRMSLRIKRQRRKNLSRSTKLMKF